MGGVLIGSMIAQHKLFGDIKETDYERRENKNIILAGILSVLIGVLAAIIVFLFYTYR